MPYSHHAKKTPCGATREVEVEDHGSLWTHALLLGWSGGGISCDERLWNLLHNLYLLLARRDEALLKLGLDRGGNILIIRKLILLLG